MRKYQTNCLSFFPIIFLVILSYLIGPGSGIAQEANAELLRLKKDLSVPDEMNLARIDSGLVVLYKFSEGRGSKVLDVSEINPALDLTVSDTNRVEWLEDGGLSLDSVDVKIESEIPATKLFNRLSASNEFTVEVWVQSANLTQSGPARIVSYSLDAGQRNFTLGQERDSLAFRLRTPESGLNGSKPSLIIPGIFDLSLTHIVSTFDGDTSKVYVNGELQAPVLKLTGGFSNWDDSHLVILGNETSLDRQWLGKLYLVAVYDRALTLEEVGKNSKAGLPPVGQVRPRWRRQIYWQEAAIRVFGRMRINLR
jgi:hypothetical protein